MFLLIAVFLVAPVTVLARSVISLGKPTGYVNDYTNTLSGMDKSQLESISQNLEDANKCQMAIVVIDSTDGRTIEDYAQDLFQMWGIGHKGADNGLLILVAMRDHRWRVQTGYGIENVLPDTLASRIMYAEAVPAFKEGKYGKGLIDAASMFKSVLQGEKYVVPGFNFSVLIFPGLALGLIGTFIWLAVRVRCPRCGSRVTMTSDRDILEANYNHSGIHKVEYECSVCHFKFARMKTLPMMVASSSSSYNGGFFGGWVGGGGGGGFGGGGFGGFGGGGSGGGGASGGW